MSSNDSESRILPKDYQPGDSVVIIGRGKKCLLHEGNKRLRVIVKAELETYQEARDKSDKSIILRSIVRQVRKSNEQGVGFVKQDLITGRWLELTEVASRVTVAQAFRDALSNQYKSSKQSKQHKRHLERLRHCRPKAGVFPAHHVPSNGTGFYVHDAIATARARNQMAFKQANNNWQQGFGANWGAPMMGGSSPQSLQSCLLSALAIMDHTGGQPQGMTNPAGMWCPSSTPMHPMMSYPGCGQPAQHQAPAFVNQGFAPQPQFASSGAMPEQAQIVSGVSKEGRHSDDFDTFSFHEVDDLSVHEVSDYATSDEELSRGDHESIESCKPEQKDLFDVFNSIPLDTLKAALSS